MSESLETTISKLDDLCQVLEETDLFSQNKRSDQAIALFHTEAKQYLVEKKYIVQELELDYKKGLEKQQLLLKAVQESENSMSLRRQQMEEYQNKVAEESLRRDKLLIELKSVEQQIEKENSDETLEKDLISDILKLAIYRKMGIQMQVEDDLHVKKAILTTQDSQDIRTIPVENQNIKQTVKTIWEFISNDLE